MPKFKKKPVVIDAVQWKGSNFVEIDEFINQPHETYPKDGFIIIKTLEGNMRADINDWIIKGVQGEFYPCKPDIFEATYQKVETEKTLFGELPRYRKLFKATTTPTDNWPIADCGCSAIDDKDWHISTNHLKSDEVPEEMADAKTSAELIARLLNAHYNGQIELPDEKE